MPPLPRRSVLPALILCLCAAGCDTSTAASGLLEPETPEPQLPASASAFDPANCGQVTGQVVWPGPLASADDFIYGIPDGSGSFNTRMMSNPNRPRINAKSRAVAGAVVFLRGIDPSKAKPWDLPPAKVEMKDRQIVIRQGEGEAQRAGFVRRGDTVSMAAVESVYHVLRGRGASYFSYTFPDPNQPLSRTFIRPGRVELSSGAGYYWASADLFVDNHPYYTLTALDGRFTLDQVPAGNLELAVWMPGWQPLHQERDPESAVVVRQTYTPPVEVVRRVAVERGRTAVLNVSVP